MEAQGTESVGRVSKEKTIFNANSCINSITQLKNKGSTKTQVFSCYVIVEMVQKRIQLPR